jgi:hypothetical protein
MLAEIGQGLNQPAFVNWRRAYWAREIWKSATFEATDLIVFRNLLVVPDSAGGFHVRRPTMKIENVIAMAPLW